MKSSASETKLFQRLRAVSDIQPKTIIYCSSQTYKTENKAHESGG